MLRRIRLGSFLSVMVPVISSRRDCGDVTGAEAPFDIFRGSVAPSVIEE